ncbi:MAG: hypothetical protein PHY16_02710 [Methylobacter sp.]|nr:hypothetical protein [Methylobacter sp.]
MNEDSEKQACEPESIEMSTSHIHRDIPDQDDRYPGSFFRIPGPPILGKTTWSIS